MRLPIDGSSKFISYFGICAALIAVMSFAEAQLNINLGVPGVKFGLSNSVIILALYFSGYKAAFLLTAVKIIFSAVIASGMSGLLFTAGGSIAATAAMCLIKLILKKKVSAIGISAMGGFFHITVQYICSGFILGTFSVIRLYPLAAVLSLLTSAAVGFICNMLLKRACGAV